MMPHCTHTRARPLHLHQLFQYLRTLDGILFVAAIDVFTYEEHNIKLLDFRQMRSLLILLQAGIKINEYPFFKIVIWTYHYFFHTIQVSSCRHIKRTNQVLAALVLYQRFVIRQRFWWRGHQNPADWKNFIHKIDFRMLWAEPNIKIVPESCLSMV